ncbi:hypothetical protein J6590_091713 [Homalodisca vitripennis]|nr:hypothetical protein J6590_091713 [Homalodisca vitripennis]
MTTLVTALVITAHTHSHISRHLVKMTLSMSTRLVRGGSAVQRTYWRASPSSNSSPKLVKHGRVLNFGPDKLPPSQSILLQQKDVWRPSSSSLRDFVECLVTESFSMGDQFRVVYKCI